MASGRQFLVSQMASNKHLRGQLPPGRLDHDPAEDHAGSDIAMEGLDQLQKIIKGIGTDIHSRITESKRGLRQGPPRPKRAPGREMRTHKSEVIEADPARTSYPLLISPWGSY